MLTNILVNKFKCDAQKYTSQQKNRYMNILRIFHFYNRRDDEWLYYQLHFGSKLTNIVSYCP